MTAAADARAAAQAREAVAHAQSHLVRISTCIRHASTASVGEVLIALDAAQEAGEALWEDLAFIDAALAEVTR
jgi:hypothetical protein